MIVQFELATGFTALSRCRTSARSRRCPIWDLDSGLGCDPPVGHGLFECVVVPLVLVSIGLGESGDRSVEGRAGAQVGGEGDAVTGASVGSGQSPAAHPSITGETSGDHHVGVDRALPVLQLADVEVSTY